MRYILDTSKVVDYLRGEETAVDQLQSLKDEGLAVSIVSVAELYEGVSRDLILRRPKAS